MKTSFEEARDFPKGFGTKMLVAEKIDRNFDVIAPLNDVYDPVAGSMGRQKKWGFINAAILMFLDLPLEAQKWIAGEIIAADARGDTFRDLISRARSGALRLEAIEQGKRAAAPPTSPREAAGRPSARGRRA